MRIAGWQALQLSRGKMLPRIFPPHRGEPDLVWDQSDSVGEALFGAEHQLAGHADWLAGTCPEQRPLIHALPIAFGSRIAGGRQHLGQARRRHLRLV